MIEFIIELLYPLTIVLTILLVSHQVVLNKLGAKAVYCLWVTVPLALVFYCIKLKWLSSSAMLEGSMSRYIAMPKAVLQQGVNFDWLLIIWAAVSLLLVLYFFFSSWSYQNNLHLSKVVNTTKATLPKSLLMFQSSHAHSPMLIGVIKQKLIIPEDFFLLYNEEQQALILQHEICHFDRNDIYWNLIAFTFLTLFWFHPLVWLAYFRFRRDQEISCDQTVLARKQTESRINYGKALLVAAETTPPLAFAQLSFKKFGDKNIMFERIKHIKHNKKTNPFTFILASLLSISMLTGISYAGNSSTQGKLESQKEAKLFPLVRVEPKYPIEAVEKGIEGSVVLKFNVTATGKVAEVSVLKAVPEKVFDKQAKVALRQWQYDSGGVEHENLLVQLDFVMSEDSVVKNNDLLEKLKVSSH